MTLNPENAAAILRYEKSLDCIHCGICLSQCPTYLETGDEAASPRGRIALMRGLAEGKLSITESLEEKMSLCLVCRACESVCPSAVDFSGMMEITRHEIFEQEKGSRLARGVKRYLLRRVVPDRKKLGRLAAFTRFYRRSGLQWLMRRLGLVKLLPKALARMEAMTPEVPKASERRPVPEVSPATGAAHRGRVAILSGCVMEQLFGAINRQTVAALQHQGFEVVAPPSQTCCGALQAHSGDLETAIELAKRNIKAFDTVEVDWLVLNSAGCGAAIKDYPRWLAADSVWRERAEILAAKCIDVTVLFDRLKLQPRGAADQSRKVVAYDAPCHLHHAQACPTETPRLLARIPGIELRPLVGAEHCCGAAGLYSTTEPEMSDDILARKIANLKASGAEVLITGNPGCILQWQRGITNANLNIRVHHPTHYL